MSHIDQHQDLVVPHRVVYLRTEVPHFGQSRSLQAERCLANAAAHFCAHKQQTLVVGVSYYSLYIKMFKQFWLIIVTWRYPCSSFQPLLKQFWKILTNLVGLLCFHGHKLAKLKVWLMSDPTQSSQNSWSSDLWDEEPANHVLNWALGLYLRSEWLTEKRSFEIDWARRILTDVRQSCHVWIMLGHAVLGHCCSLF